MAVEIDIDLSAADARGKVESLRAEIASLEDSLDVDLSFDEDLDEIADSLDNFTTKIEDLRMELDGLEADLSETLSELDDTQIGVRMPDGETGATGGENDPPTQTFNIRTEGLSEAMSDGGDGRDNTRAAARRIASSVEDLYGIDAGSLNERLLEGVEASKLQESVADFHHAVDSYNRDGFYHPGIDRVGGDIGPSYDNAANLGAASVPDDVLPDDEGGSFAGDFGFGTEPMSQHLRRLRELDAGELADVLSGSSGGGFLGSVTDRDTSGFKKLGNFLKTTNRRINRFGGALRRLKPSMRMWWQLLAMVLPLLIAVGVQAAGAAAAMLGLAAAAGAVVGMGLLGHADSLSGSLQQARQELSNLRDDLFETFQGPMQLFAPIQSEIFDWLPGQLVSVADSMEGLTAYEGTIFQMFSGLADGVEQFFRILTSNEDIISQLAMRFGSLVGGGLLRGFEWLIQTAYRNQEVLIDLGSVLMDILTILYNLSMFVGRVVAALRPLFNWLAGLSNLLNNKLVVGLLTFLTVAGLIGVGVTSLAVKVYTLVTAVQALVAWLGMLGGGSVIAGISAFFGMLWSYIQATVIALMEMYSAAQLAAMALAATGVGALVVGAGLTAGAAAMNGMSGPDNPGGGGPPTGGGGGGYGGGQQVVYNDNRQYTIQNEGQMDNASEQRIRSTIDEVNAEGDAMAPPEVGVNEGN